MPTLATFGKLDGRSITIGRFLDMIGVPTNDLYIPQMRSLSDHATDISLKPGRLPIDATDAAFRPLLNVPVTKPMMYVSRHSPTST